MTDHIGDFIRNSRKWRGLTQQELADATGLSVMSIRRYESGERKPTMEIVETIMSALRQYSSDLDERLGFSLGSDVIIRDSDGDSFLIPGGSREARLLISFQAMNDLGKDEVIRYAENLLEADKFKRSHK